MLQHFMKWKTLNMVKTLADGSFPAIVPRVLKHFGTLAKLSTFKCP